MSGSRLFMPNGTRRHTGATFLPAVLGTIACATMFVAPAQAQFTWTGSVSTSATDTGNWSSSVPSFGTTISSGRLNVYSGSNNELVYTADQGSTTFTNGRGILIGGAPSGIANGRMTITGGTVSTVGNSDVAGLGGAGSTGVLTVSGGLFQASSNGLGVGVGTNTGNGTLTVSGSGRAVIPLFGVTSASAGATTATINADGGTLSLGSTSISALATTTFNFNSGTVRSTANSLSLFNNFDTLNVRNGGAVFDTAGFNLTIGQSLLRSVIGGDAAIDGGLRKLGDGTLTLSGSNGYTGATAVTEGALRVTHANALGGTERGTTISDAARLELSGGITVQGESLTLTGAGNGFGAAAIGALRSVSGTNTWAGPITLTGASTLYGNRVGGSADTALVLSGLISGTGGLIIRGDGATSSTAIVEISGAGSSYSGDTSIYAGTLRLAGGNDRLPTGGAVVMGVAATSLHGTLDLGGVNQTVAGLVSEGSNAALQTIGNSSTSADSTLTVNLGSGTNTFAGRIVDSLSGGTRKLAVTKSGAGRLILGGSNTYTGDTTIQHGTLQLAAGGSLADSQRLVVGSAGSTGAVLDLTTALDGSNIFTVGAAQTLMGRGTVDLDSGTLRVAGTLSPGNSPGNLTIDGTLAWESTDAGYLWEINDATGAAGAAWDLVTVTGALDLSALSAETRYGIDLVTLDLANAAGPMVNYVNGENYAWKLVSASSVLLPGGAAAGGTDITSLFNVSFAGWANPAPGTGNFSIRVSDGGSGIELVVVPEPHAVILAGIGVAIVAQLGRKRRRTA
jgi:fibronectin-binding autotransporter adhesin